MAKPGTRTPASTSRNLFRFWRWGLIGLAVLVALLLTTGVVLRHVLSTESLERRLSHAVAGATDSLYRVKLGLVDVSLLRRSVAAEDVVLQPDTVQLRRQHEAGQGPAVACAVTVADLRLDGVRLWALLWNQTLELDAVEVHRPLVHLLVNTDADAVPDSLSPSPDSARASANDSPSSLHARIARQVPRLRIGRVRIDHAALAWTRRDGTTTRADTLEGISLQLDGVRVDSAAARDSSRVLFSDDVRLAADGYRHRFPDGLYVLDVGPVQASSRDATFTVASLRWEPVVSDSVFMQRQPHRVDRFRTHFGTITLRGLDYWSLLERGGLIATSAAIDTPAVDVYSDRTLPERPPGPPLPLPHEAFQTIQHPVRIDTIHILQGDVRYSERAPDGVRPGTILFADLWSTIVNVTNDPHRMTAATPAVVQARTRVAGEGLLQTTITYNLLTPQLNMAYRGTLGSMDAGAFNSVFVDLAGVRITSGRLDSVWFDIDVHQNVADGTLQVLYHDLKVQTLDKATGRRNLGDRVETFIANQIVIDADNQPRDDAPAEVATIHEQRTDEPLFNFLWTTLRSGLFSTVGFR